VLDAVERGWVEQAVREARDAGVPEQTIRCDVEEAMRPGVDIFAAIELIGRLRWRVDATRTSNGRANTPL
jgi:hypothetical protein